MSILNMHSKVIFIHVPKTGGSSMEANDYISGGGHQSIRFFRRFVELSSRGLNYSDYFKFGFVRNPYDRFMSALTAHYMGHGGANQEDVSRNNPLTKDGFLNATIYVGQNYATVWKEPPEGKYIHFVPQYMFLCIWKPEDLALSWLGRIEVDFVGKFENMENDWRQIESAIGVPHKPLKHILKNDFQDYDSLWTDQAREIVYNLYKKDFEVFGYER